jgi:hypothetical protein
MLSVKDILDSLTHYPTENPIPPPPYTPKEGSRIMLAVPSMERHMSNEGWQLALALQAGGYDICGHPLSTTDVNILLQEKNPSVVMVQDQHEWDSGHLAIKEEYFHNSKTLASRPDIFKLTVVKDTHRQYESAKRYSNDIGCNAWICYYHPAIVLRTLNWIRPRHLIRTYHTIDADAVPPYKSEGRKPCLLSGSLGGAYPLREKIHQANLPLVTFIRHPGYSNNGSSTPAYLKELSKYKVAICTASKFGYALRKHMEAVACGCRVITDLPRDEVLPGIDHNLVRVSPNITMPDLSQLIQKLCDEYDPIHQENVAKEAASYYDYRVEGMRLAAEIERVRNNY